MRPSSDPGGRPRASVVGSLIQGWSRALHAPWVAAGLLLAMFLVPLPESPENRLEGAPRPGSIDVAGPVIIHELLGPLRPATDAVRRLEDAWIADYATRAVLAYLALWLFLAGGVVDRLARGRPVGTAQFFAACGVYFVRLVRLTLVVAPVYALLFLGFDRWPAHPALLAVTALVNLLLDTTVIRTVVEDRHSVLGSIAAAVRFVRRRPLRLGALYLLNVGVMVLLAQLWAVGARLTPWIGLATPVVLLIYVWSRLAFIGSQIVFFQGELAHAHYTAAPPLIWPDSASVEAIDNLRRAARVSGPRRDTDGSQ
jgi:hypothetical protein